MGWFLGSTQAGAKRLIAHLGDAAKRDRAIRALIRLNADAAPWLIESLQSRNEELLPIYQQVLPRIPAGTAGR